MIEIIEKHEISPVCPHCKTELHQLWSQTLSGFLGKRYIYFCPHCRATLGVSHRKGFWMG